MLDAAREAGIDTVDTARGYGMSEEVIGDVIGDEPDWRLITKLDAAAHEVADGASAAQAAWLSLAASRRALRRDRLDAVLLHRPEQRTAFGSEIWNVLREEREGGRIDAIGISAVQPADATAALDDSEVQIVQVAASIFDRRLADAGFFDLAIARGVEVFVRSVFLQGAALLGTSELPRHLAVLGSELKRVDAVLEDKGATRRDLCLAYVRDRLPGATAVIGCETLEQLEENVASWHSPVVPSALVDEAIERIGVLPQEVVEPWRWPEKDRPLASRGSRRR